MDRFAPLKLLEFDHLEFAVSDLEKASAVWHRIGFEKVGTREILERNLRSHLFAQNQTFILLSSSTLRTDPISRFVQTHGDGICNVALRCEDAVGALDLTSNRGASVVESPKFYRRDFGSVHSASIRAVGNIRHTFISRTGNLFAEGFEVPIKAPRRPAGIRRLEHLSLNVETGKLDFWTEFYGRVFGLVPSPVQEVDLEVGKVQTRLLQSPAGALPLRLTEPLSGQSSVQDYLNINHGPGIQHAAFATENILATLRPLRKEGIPFRGLPGADDDLSGLEFSAAELRDAGVSAERSREGYLLRAYTQPLIGPFFVEIAQRQNYPELGTEAYRRLLAALPVGQS